MAELPVQRAPSVGISGSGLQYFGVRASGQAFGTGVGQALNAFSGVLAQTADLAFQARQVEEEASTMESFATARDGLRDLLYNPEAGLLNRRGGAASGIGTEADAWMTEYLAEFEGAGHSPRTQQAFRQFWDQTRTSTLNQLATYELGEAQEYRAQSADALVASAQQDVFFNYADDTAIAGAIASTRRTVAAATVGMPPEATQQAELAAVSNIHRTVITQRAATDPYSAQAYYEANAESMTPQDNSAVQQILRPALVQAGANDAYSVAMGIGSGAAALAPAGLTTAPGTPSLAPTPGATPTAAQSSQAALQQNLERFGGDSAAAMIATTGGDAVVQAWLTSGRDNTTLPAAVSLELSRAAATQTVSLALNLLIDREGFDATARDDITIRDGQRVSAGLIIGHGSDTITREDGTVVPVTAGMTVTRADAQRDLERRIGEQQVSVIRDVGQDAWNALPPAAQAALISMSYNYGSFANLLSLRAAVQTGDLKQIAAAIEARRGDNSGINSNRRQIEADMVRGATAAPGARAVTVATPQGGTAPAAIVNPVGFDYETAVAIGNSIADTDTRERYFQMIEAERQRSERVAGLAQSSAEQSLWEHVIGGGSVASAPPELLAQVSPSFINTLSTTAGNLAGGGVQQNWAAYTQFAALPDSALAGITPNDFYTTFFPLFDQEHFEKALTRYNDIRESGVSSVASTNTFEPTAMMNTTIEGIYPQGSQAGNRNQLAARLQPQLDLRINSEATRLGRSLSGPEIQGVIDLLLISDQSRSGGNFFHSSSTAGRAVEQPIGQPLTRPPTTTLPNSAFTNLTGFDPVLPDATGFEQIPVTDRGRLAFTYSERHLTDVPAELGASLYNRAVRVWLGGRPEIADDADGRAFRSYFQAQAGREPTQSDVDYYYGQWLLGYIGRSSWQPDVSLIPPSVAPPPSGPVGAVPTAPRQFLGGPPNTSGGSGWPLG